MSIRLTEREKMAIVESLESTSKPFKILAGTAVALFIAAIVVEARRPYDPYAF